MTIRSLNRCESCDYWTNENPSVACAKTAGACGKWGKSLKEVVAAVFGIARGIWLEHVVSGCMVFYYL